MPEMDGPTLLKELRKRNPDIKIIFVSGYAEDAFHKTLGAGGGANPRAGRFPAKRWGGGGEGGVGGVAVRATRSPRVPGEWSEAERDPGPRPMAACRRLSCVE